MTDVQRLLTVCLVISLAGCASERVVLLPSPDGRPSAVLVRNDRGEQMLNQPFAESVRRSGYNRVKQAASDKVQQRYASSLAAQPLRGQSFMLFFDDGSEVPKPDSLPVLEQARTEIGRRAAAEVVVIGHADRVGSEAENEALSQRRVESVRSMLMAAGIAESDIETAFRGEREPLVATPDGVADPMNRRVEISVR